MDAKRGAINMVRNVGVEISDQVNTTRSDGHAHQREVRNRLGWSQPMHGSVGGCKMIDINVMASVAR